MRFLAHHHLFANLATCTWARGVTTTYSYTQGLLTLTDYSDTTPDVAITYDGYGRQFTVTQTNQSKITYSYNPTTLALASELIQYDTDRNGSYEFTRTLDRTRDPLLRDTGYFLMDKEPIEAASAYTYSPTDGRISQISNPQISNQVFSYSYTPNSNLLASVSGPIHTVTNTWEPNRDVLDLKQNKVGSTVISNYGYIVNAIAQRTGVTTSGTAFPALPSWAWSYDALGQVIAADSSVATSDRSYQYDTIGNRQKAANSLTLPAANNYAANSLNQYTSVPSVASVPSYDFDGNMTSGPLPTAPAANSTLIWDAENRLISTTVGSNTITYQYDAQSRRIAKAVGTSATIVYIYDAWNCIARYSVNVGTLSLTFLQKTRLWGTDLSGTLQGAGGVGGLLAENTNQLSAPPIHYPTYDGNGNISEYLSATGTLAAHFEYDPFGNTVVNTDTSNQFTYKFSTKPADSETGLYYYGYRYYDPMTGRWPSRDPIEEEGGVNLYAFVGNDRVRRWDLLGLCEVDEVKITKSEVTTMSLSDATKSTIESTKAESFLTWLFRKVTGVAVPKKPTINSLDQVWGWKMIIKFSCCECKDGKNSWVEKEDITEKSVSPTSTQKDAQTEGEGKMEEMEQNATCP